MHAIDFLFLTNVDFYSHNQSSSSPVGNPKRGKMVTVNGRKLAVFLYNGKAYAIDEKCPHLGECRMVFGFLPSLFPVAV
jgi:hypothetical protein